ncbi:hypothetical protein XELAEV_18036764mg [Xenopus laevis]|uniref:Uncharacterized protein n=1 Tax=Xenopus laevis TaxID=8355 RepID=A0A974CAT9_XENLA|nr:hypothetical protein XELAEV_18036764mg [Xenopus laevis]
MIKKTQVTVTKSFLLCPLRSLCSHPTPPSTFCGLTVQFQVSLAPTSDFRFIVSSLTYGLASQCPVGFHPY